MSSVGILSMQRIANYGSFLQAYGLKSILEELGCQVQFVDYHPGKTLIPADGGTGIRHKMHKAKEVLDSRASLRDKIRYIRYKKSYASKYYPCLGIDERRNYCPELDLLVVGSDEVFNCVQNNPHVGFSPELFGEGNHAKRLISYAASFGNTTQQKLEQYHLTDQVGAWLKKFDALSVRDANSAALVETLSERMPEYHLDPVLAYDFIGKCREIPKHVPEKKYMILYGYSGRFSKEECNIIREYAEQKGLKIVCIGGIQDCCDRFIDCTPFQVIAYFQSAECVVTDTFHGTILSVITHRQFVSIVRNSNYGNSEKLTDLLNRLKLSNRIVRDRKRIPEMLSESIDYTDTDSVILAERRRTYEYLKRQLCFLDEG